jgi:pSer/pThr/pTyr-binding forkhead associated (FHA) protein
MRAFRSRPDDGSPVVRACDADRDRVIAELRDRFADGSLAQESFLFRVDAALRARWRGDLAEIVSDLPAPRVPAVRAALGHLSRAGRTARRRLAGYLGQPLPAFVLPSGTRDSFTIGRDASCDLVLADMSVSRSHAGLRREAGRWPLSDAGSTNGTRLNGWRVTEPVLLRPGDEVSFGSMTLVVTDHARQASAAFGTP